MTGGERTEDETDRCGEYVRITGTVRKRCIRARGHAEAHAWIEAAEVAGRLPLLFRWNDTGAPAVYEYRALWSEATGA